MSNYYDGLNEKLLAAIPQGAKKVLELGCANGRLGRRYKEVNPHTQWWGIDLSEEAVEIASSYLDVVRCLDIDQTDLRSLGAGFDVIVIGDLLEHLREPEKTLEALNDLTVDGGRLVCCVPNMSHVSVIQRLVAGDITYDDAGLLDRTHTRFFSQASVFKTLLDCGWLPHLQDSYRVEAAPTGFNAHIVAAAESLGIPRATATRNLGLYQMIVDCRKWSMQDLATPGPRAKFSIIVPVNNPWQHQLNIAKSPGLKEVDADIICVEQAPSAAHAYERGAAAAKHPWRLFVHQDVYFPKGSGFAIAQQLGRLDAGGKTKAAVGFAGVSTKSLGEEPMTLAHSGMVIDRTALFDYEGTDVALSIDEFAVAIHRDCQTPLDPHLGWHLWATDLCLQALTFRAATLGASILRVPLFHNSLNDFRLPESFHKSAQVILAKYPGLNRIPTLCGELRRQAVSA